MRDGVRGGVDWDEGVEVARALDRGSVDALIPSAGTSSFNPMLLFHGDSLADGMIEQDGPSSMNPFLDHGGDVGAFGDPLVSPEDLEYYVSAFEHSGFGGGINRYRNVDRNLEEVPALGQARLDLSC